jgi:hypothetical protein
MTPICSETGRSFMQRFRLLRVYMLLVVAALGMAIAAATMFRTR